jgi:hypothetical protein
VDQRDLERIARSVLKELGLADRGMTFEPDARPDLWRLTVSGHPSVIVKCGRGTTAQFVRNQIFEQLQSR